MKRSIGFALTLMLITMFFIGCSSMGNNQELVNELNNFEEQVADLKDEISEKDDAIAELKEEIEDFGDLDINGEGFDEITEDLERLGEENVMLKTRNDSLLIVIEELEAKLSETPANGGGTGSGTRPTVPQVQLD